MMGYLSKLNQLFVKTSGEGEPLIVLHGWGMNSAVWEPVRATLEKQFCVSWIDLPGHGKNSHIKADSLDEIVELILPHISQTPNNTHLMGWSLGGLIIQAIAQRIPENIKCMTMVASTPRFSQTENWHHAMSDEVLSNFSENLSKDIEGTLKRFIALQFMGVKSTKTIQRELTQAVIANISRETEDKDKKAIKGGGTSTPLSRTVLYTEKALRLGLDILRYSDFRQTQHEIPQHWLLAERDRLIPKEIINDLKLIRPNAQITLLENTGHALFMTHPEEFLESIVPFIKAIKAHQ